MTNEEAVEKALQRGDAAIRAALPPESEQIDDRDWIVPTDWGRVLLRLVVLGGRPHVLVNAHVADLPVDNIQGFYARLLEYNRPEHLGPSKMFITDDRVVMCQVHLAEALDPGEVQAALMSLGGAAAFFRGQLTKEFPTQPES